ncbi:MAG: TetR/AcrR family transcriptional regulator [Actinomycetota bacterium]
MVGEGEDGGDGETRKPGRPSVRDERRVQILDAFLHLVRQRGHSEVTVSEVAAEAGVHRSAVRHFVGNRKDLVIGALDRIDERYDEMFEEAIGPDPTLDALLDHLFDQAHLADTSHIDEAYFALMTAGIGDLELRAHLRGALAREIEWLAAMLTPDGDPEAMSVAYQIVCLAEHNVFLQRVGLEQRFSDDARRLADRLVQEYRAGRS